MRHLIEIQNLCLDYPYRVDQTGSVSRTLLEEWRRWRQRRSRPCHRALDKVSLQVRPGERWGVIGANGSGKTSLVKVISRILWPTEGAVQLNGRVLPLIDLDSGCSPELTGRENLILMGLLLGEPRRKMEERLDGLIALSGLEDFADVPVRDYSTGMRGRLGFALISSLNAEILVLDEMLATTDASFVRLAGQRLKTVISSAGCAVIVSHTMDFIEEVCTHALWLHQGQVRAMGPAKDLAREYYQWSLSASHQIKRISSPKALLEL